MKKRNGGSRHKSGKGKRRAPAGAYAKSTAAHRSHSAGSTAGAGLLTRKRNATAAQAVPARYSDDERLSLAVLLSPFLILAASLASQHMLRVPVAAVAPTPTVASIDQGRTLPDSIPTVPPARVESSPAPLDLTGVVGQAGGRIRVAVKRAPLPALALLPLPQPEVKPTPSRESQQAALNPAITSLDAPGLPQPTPPPAGDVAGPSMPMAPAQCLPKPDLMTRAKALWAGISPAEGAKGFGRMLARAALAQLDDLVIYNARYARLPFPNGDIAPLYGVCTDVIVRAYRSLDIDLQQLVQQTRSGRGDPNIDHRRVEVLRKFLDKHGEVLPITDLAEDYQPGDIVTYYRPQNRTTTTHIAIVSDVLAPSGRLMIVHNRGWGPQLEDALFVDKITGHYRFTGLPVEARSASGSSLESRREAPSKAGLTFTGKMAAFRTQEALAAKR